MSGPVTIHVCVTCRAGPDGFERPGAKFADAIDARLNGDGAIRLQRVECMQVCKRPCTVALSGAGKWTYVVADVTQDANLEDVLAAARLYAATPDGVMPWRERPAPFRRNVVSRIPPLRIDP